MEVVESIWGRRALVDIGTSLDYIPRDIMFASARDGNRSILTIEQSICNPEKPHDYVLPPGNSSILPTLEVESVRLTSCIMHGQFGIEQRHLAHRRE